MVYHAGSCWNAQWENEDKGGIETETSWQAARTERSEVTESFTERKGALKIKCVKANWYDRSRDMP